LRAGGVAKPDVLLVSYRGRDIVVKDFAARARERWLRATLGRLLARREARAWQALADHAAVPRFLGMVDALAFAVEYRPGRALTSRVAPLLSQEFVDRLAAAIDEMHARGVVHLDLRHRSNVLLGDDGAPVLIDFGSALVAPPGSLRARAATWGVGWIDRQALAKWRSYALGGGRSAGSRGASRLT
jgi:tRNA A-37 threonylcarbamoyl transferase component Bud32